MARKERYQTRLDPDTAERVDEFAEDRDVTKAEALRRLVEHGLDHADEDTLSAEEIRNDLKGIRDDLDDEPETRTLRSGSMGSSFLQVVQVALTLALFVLVWGGL